MEFEEFCERAQTLFFGELEAMYEDTAGQDWETIETLLRERLILKQALRSRSRRSKEYLNLLNSAGQELYERLRLVRRRLAQEHQVPAYVVFSNRTLFEMSRALPFTMEELKELYGVGNLNSALYGKPFLDEIHAFSDGKKEETCAPAFLEKGEEAYPLLFGSVRR